MREITIACLLLFFTSSIFGQVNIHYWDFNSGASTTTGMKWPSPISATNSVNAGTISHDFDYTDNFGGSTLDAPSFSSSTAGDSYSIVGTNNNGFSLTINASTLGYKDIRLTYATRGTASGFTTHDIAYSIDGINFTTLTTITGRTATSFSLQTINFISLPAANNNPNFKIRITLSGATSPSGNNRIDNIRVTGIESPCAPTNQPTGLALNASFNNISGSFNPAGAGSINASAYLVLVSPFNTPGSQPANGQEYNADDIIGNSVVVSVGNTTSFNAGSLTPGTPYYFFIYSYDASSNCYNFVAPLTGTINTTTPPACTAPTTQANSLTASVITGNSINLNYTRGSGDKVLIVARIGAPVTQAPFNSVAYPVGSETSTGNLVIYNGVASSFNYNSLSPNTNYHFAVFEFNNTGNCYKTPGLTGNFTTACITPANVTSFTPAAGNAHISFTWTNPGASCYDQLLIVASTATITGAGSSYTAPANANYVSGEQVVYRGNGNSINVTGLTNNTGYYFRIFTRLGSSWSSGSEVTAQPFDAATGFQYLFGNLHAHSSYSDGNKDNTSKTPKDDFEFARDANCMDFLGISEHNHSGAGMSYPDYLRGYNHAQTVNGVTSPNTGNSIVTLWGMEWGVISNGGHVLVYGLEDKLVGWEAGNYDIFVAKNDYTGLWNAVNNHPGAFATLAHPHTSDYNDLSSAFMASAASAIVGSAVESGPAFSVSTTYNDYPSPLSDISYFKSLLAKGYYVAPQMDQDNHYMTFGTANANRTVVLATSKSRTALMEALRARRYYASQDCNVRVDFKSGQDPMGSILTRGGRPSLSLLVIDPDGETVSNIELWGGQTGATQPSFPIATYSNTSSFNFTSGDAANLQANNSSWYYFVIITQADGNKIVSAPIWYTRSDLVLPFTLMSFKGAWNASSDKIFLNWSTARELESREFIIQRATGDGLAWTDIGRVTAAGSSAFEKQYNFTDNDPASVNHYRLKMIDHDNSYTYSNVVMLSKEASNNLIVVYPNPAKQFVNISIAGMPAQKLNIRISDNAGRVLQHQEIISNNNNVQLRLDNYKPGMYYISINGKTQKLIVSPN